MNRPEISVTVTLKADGQVSVMGPLEQKLVLIAILDEAKEIVRKYNDKPIEQRGIVRPVRGTLEL